MGRRRPGRYSFVPLGNQRALAKSLFPFGHDTAPPLRCSGAMTAHPVVLIVDDEADLAESCARLLRRRGYRVVTVNSREAGHAALRTSRPHLLVSDVRLPDGDGLQLVRDAHALNPPVPAVVISGYLSEANRAAARAAGVVEFLSKPFSNEAFGRAVDKALEAAQRMTAPLRPDPTPAVVAIGSSADGFRALGTILKSLPAGLPAAVLIVQHRAPHDRGYLANLLRAQTGLEVTDAIDGEPLRRGVVYIAPPNRHLLVEDGHLRLSDASSVNFSRPSVDVLFDSVARGYGEHAIGVILSGGGSDGAAGLQAIRHGGGRTIVQAPADAKSPGMPTAALGRDGIEFVLKLEEIGPAVAKLIRAE